MAITPGVYLVKLIRCADHLNAVETSFPGWTRFNLSD